MNSHSSSVCILLRFIRATSFGDSKYSLGPEGEMLSSAAIDSRLFSHFEFENAWCSLASLRGGTDLRTFGGLPPILPIEIKRRLRLPRRASLNASVEK